MKYFILNVKSKTQDGVLDEIARFAKEKKIVSSVPKVVAAFKEREAEGTTGFEDGIAIPHARVTEIKENAVIIARHKDGVDWKSLDGKSTTTAISILVAKDGNEGDAHVEILSKIASTLLDKKNVEIYKKANITQVKNLISSFETQKSQRPKGKKWDFIAITSCPTGVAHTNMSAEAILKFAKENNLNVKVERQAAQGTVDELTAEDVKNTEFLLVAAGRPTDNMGRFNGLKILTKGVAAPLKDMKKVYKELKEVKTISKISGGSDNSSNAKSGVSPMKALMNGLSYMIPIIIVGGILIAFGLGIGRLVTGEDVGANPGTFWHAMLQLGVVGINLSVIVLGGYTAYAIGGRLALAPAMILAFMAQGIGIGPSNTTFFNWESLEFGVSGASLSFFGAIAAGLLVGYATLLWNKHVSPKIPKAIKTIEPIIIVPILFTVVGWALFSFFLYLPLYYLSLGLNEGVERLVDANLLWIAGMIGGAMLCFDLGGPVNKIAFGIGVAMINTHPEVMGGIAAAGAVAPFGMAFGWLLGKKVFRIKAFKNDELSKEAFVPALFMGFLGISEGAIPFALRYPKSAIISNVIGGAIAGALASSFLITDTAAHTGPIVYLLGAIGKNGMTDYGYGLLYLLAWAIGSAVTAILFPVMEIGMNKIFKDKKSNSKITKSNELKNESKMISK